ncbi:MinD/ParA family protein [Alkalibacillus haloalkaliphilus]|uniref:Flagellum site-determining protein YlxH n=1 Tax=Alkalibacillus haloalkaliphilus TaxID=94136 RepID=A0A511W1N6_9BACI|nr:MinD/ParA family protein [Alkalibacillus haloalkaliphilus]GEN44937.1 flagellum site-determining protein YlxH [Alkalibacillus haloalkaliphilus]
MNKDQAHDLRIKMNQQTEEHAHTIAVFSGKGGVGKSNFALNFSIALGQQGKKVLIFDLDIGMGNIDILLGLQPKNSLSTMLEKNLQISDIIEEGTQGISYIAAGTGLSDFFHLDQSKYNYFIQQLQFVASTYDYIIFDLGAGMSEEHLAFIQAADESIVVTTTEPTSITDAYAAMKRLIVHSSRDHLKISLLVNRAQSEQEAQIAFTKLESVVTKFLNYKLNFIGFIREDRTVVEAVKKQIPYYILNERGKAKKSLDQVITDFMNEPVKHKNNRQFISRVRSMFTRKVD